MAKGALGLGLAMVWVLGLGGAQRAMATDIDQQLQRLPTVVGPRANRADADAQQRAGDQAAAAGQLPDAIAAWEQAAVAYHLLGDTAAERQVYAKLAVAYGRQGDLNNAEEYFQRVLALATGDRDAAAQVVALNNLGTVQLNRGNAAGAAATFNTALALAEANRDHRGLGVSRSNLGLIALQQGDLATAAEHYEAATNYRLLAGDTVGEAHSSNSLGDVYRQLGRPNNAVGAYRVALRAGEDLGDTPIQLRAIDGLLGIYFEQTNLQALQDYLDRRAALTLDPPTASLESAQTYLLLGDYHRLLDDNEAALAAYGRGLTLARQIDQTEAKNLEAALTNRVLALQDSG